MTTDAKRVAVRTAIELAVQRCRLRPQDSIEKCAEVATDAIMALAEPQVSDDTVRVSNAPFNLPTLPDDMLRTAAVAWIDNNFGMLSGKPNATERLIACFVGGLSASWESATEAFEQEWAERLTVTHPKPEPVETQP